MMKDFKLHKLNKNEEGSVMFAVIMILVIATLIGISMMNTSTLEMQISNNERLYKTAFQVSDSAPQIAGRLLEDFLANNLFSEPLPTNYESDFFAAADEKTAEEQYEQFKLESSGDINRSDVATITYTLDEHGQLLPPADKDKGQTTQTRANYRRWDWAPGSTTIIFNYIDLETTTTGYRGAQSRIDTVFQLYMQLI